MATSAASLPTAGIPLLRWLFSSIGKKTVVALTGIALVLFVVGHLLGNLTFFFGPDAINTYAVKLHDLGPLLWVARLGLLAAVGLHIFFTVLVWKENQAARPQKYAVQAPIKTTVFARTMRLSGLIILAFIAFHLAHLTLLIIHPEYAGFRTQIQGRDVPDVHRMVIAGFSSPWISGFYLLSLGLVAFHLSHGLGSLFQTLGLNNQKLRPLLEILGKITAWVLFLGYASIPIAILCGFGRKFLP